MKTIVLGGGFLGQLLQALEPEWEVFDWRPSRPAKDDETRSFGPQYLWEPIKGVTCEELQVHTTVDGMNPVTVPDRVEAYKRKVGKEQDGSDWLTQFKPFMRGYRPRLSNERVSYGKRVQWINREAGILHMANGEVHGYHQLISTIPLYALLGLLGLMDPGLRFRRIYCQTTLNTQLTPPDEMHVNYVSAPETSIYRETRINGLLTQETLTPAPGWRAITPGKVYANAIADALVEDLARTRIYCCGRFATWDPEELAHQSIENLQSRMI